MEPSTTPIRKLVPTTEMLESGRFQLSLEGARRVLFSPVQPDPILPVETDIRRGRGSICHPVLAEPTRVPDHNGPRRGCSASFTSVAGPSHISTGREPSPSTRRFHPSDRLETLRLRFAESGVSGDASALILSATRKNTNAAYQSAWNFWRNWCTTREKDPLSPSSTDIVNFLAEYSVGRSYRTVNVARSALSSTLAVNPGNVAVGVDPLVNKLLKGLYNKFPPSARYSHTWNPDTVLSYFDSTAGVALSLLELSRKVVTLLALCTLLRTYELSSISLESIVVCDSEMSFSLSKPRKAQHSGPLHRVSVAAWRLNDSICPVKCLESYLDRTAALRDANNSASLFISSNKPHGPASVPTIGRWIKEQLKLAGIDTSIFTAHSTRGAAASKAVFSGIPIQAVLDAGH